MIAPSAAERKMRGARITGLRLRRQRSHLDEAQPHGEQRSIDAGVLVEARCHADRIPEVEAPQLSRKARIVGRWRARIESELEALDGELMGALRVKRMEESLAKAEKSLHGRTRAGRR